MFLSVTRLSADQMISHTSRNTLYRLELRTLPWLSFPLIKLWRDSTSKPLALTHPIQLSTCF